MYNAFGVTNAADRFPGYAEYREPWALRWNRFAVSTNPRGTQGNSTLLVQMSKSASYPCFVFHPCPSVARFLSSSSLCLCASVVHFLFLPGCTFEQQREEVVVYCALDREFSEAVLERYELETNLRVLPKYDIESTKTVGLASALIAERNRPRCDLFWNNEILHTLRLKKLGLLESYEVDHPDRWPDQFRDQQQQWYGFAARGACSW